MTISVTSRCSLREPEALKAAAQQRPCGGAGRARSGRGFGGAPGEQLPVMAVRMGHLLNPCCMLSGCWAAHAAGGDWGARSPSDRAGHRADEQAGQPPGPGGSRSRGSVLPDRAGAAARICEGGMAEKDERHVSGARALGSGPRSPARSLHQTGELGRDCSGGVSGQPAASNTAIGSR